ncbi:flavodoxin family protein [Chloroflexota bacterium]
MKTAIIYRSFFGTTKRYAELLHKEIESDIYRYNQKDKKSIFEYGLVILCTGTYAGWISLSGYLQKYWNVLKDREIVLLVIGAAPEDVPWSVRSYEKIPGQIRGEIKYYKLPSKIDIKKASLAPIIEYVKNITSKEMKNNEKS